MVFPVAQNWMDAPAKVIGNWRQWFLVGPDHYLTIAWFIVTAPWAAIFTSPVEALET
jgi:hypothetical protein